MRIFFIVFVKSVFHHPTTSRIFNNEWGVNLANSSEMKKRKAVKIDDGTVKNIYVYEFMIKKVSYKKTF